MLPDSIATFDLLRPLVPDPARPQTNEPVSVHVIDGPEATVQFGTGFPSGLDGLIGHLESVGGPDVVVIEHAHPDHYSALPDILDRFGGVTVAAPDLDVETIETDGISVDVGLEPDDVRWGVRSIHLPGHTAGNMSFLHEDTGTLFVGDTCVHRNSFAAAAGEWSGPFAPAKPALNADDGQARESIAGLTEYEFDRALVTHGLNVFEDARRAVDTLVSDLARA